MEIKNQLEEIKQFEIELRRLLAKEKISYTDATKIEIMVYVANQSRLVNMEDLKPDAYKKARVFMYHKATEEQKIKIIRIYELMRSIDQIYRSCLIRGNAIRFFIERIDGISWSLQEAEHIENVLLNEKLIGEEKIKDFAALHLHSLSSHDSIELYKERIESIQGCVTDALCFYPIYKETMAILAKIYKFPCINLLVDDWNTFEEFKFAPEAAKEFVKEHIQNNVEEKTNILNDLFKPLTHLKDHPNSLPLGIRNELSRLLKLESRKANPQYYFCMMEALGKFINSKEK